MSENPTINCSLVATAVRDSTRKQTAELEKNRAELEKIEKETIELIKKKLVEFQNMIEMMKLANSGSTLFGAAPGAGRPSVEKSNPPPPPPNSPVAKRRQNEDFRNVDF